MKSLIPPAIKRVSVSEDGTYAVGPSLAAIQTYLSGVNNEAGLGIVSVYACIRVLAETVSSLPMILYRRLPDGGKERAIDHPLYRTFHDEPNPDMTSMIWRELLISHVAGWGNHYSEKVIDQLGNLQFWPIAPDRVEPKFEAGRKVYDYLSPDGGKTRFKDGTIFHVRGMSADGLVGYSPIALHRKAIQLYATAQEYGTNFLANGARPAVVLSHPKNLSPGAIDRLAGQVDQMRGARNAGKTLVLEEGLTLTEVGIAPQDAQYIETRKFQMQEIARIFRVPPHLIGDLDKSTFNNIEHQSREFVEHTIRPWLVRIEQEIKSQVLYDEPELSVEFLVDGLLRGDAKSRAEALAIRWQHGTLSPDEWRALENENAIENGSGDRYYVPVNYAAVGEEVALVGEPAEEQTPPQLYAVKSAAFRCPIDNVKLAENEVPGMRVLCSKCKVIREAPGLSTKGSNVSALNGFADVIRSLAEPPTVNVEAPVVNVEAAEAPVVHVRVDTESFTDAIEGLRAILIAPKVVERDSNGRMLRVVPDVEAQGA